MDTNPPTPKKATVLLVGPLWKAGGISRFVGDLLGSDIGYQIVLFNTVRPPKLDTLKGAIGYQAVLAGGVPWAIKNALITAGHILQFPFKLVWCRPSLVHIATSSHWSFWENAVYLFISKLFDSRVVFHYLGDFQNFYGSASKVEQSVIRKVFQMADGVIVLSDTVRLIISDFTDAQRVVTVRSSVNTYTATDVAADSNQVLLDEVTVLFMGGNYGVRKGVNDLIMAIPQLLVKNDRLVFWLCGGGDVQLAYESLTEGLRNKVKYWGMVDEKVKMRLLSTASLYVLPSYSEGMPYGIIEAMRWGLPVVATKIGSMPEVVVDRVNGLLITPGDVPALVESILLLARDSGLRRNMSIANREKILQFFSLDQALLVVRRTYDRVLSGVS